MAKKHDTPKEGERAVSETAKTLHGIKVPEGLVEIAKNPEALAKLEAQLQKDHDEAINGPSEEADGDELEAATVQAATGAAVQVAVEPAPADEELAQDDETVEEAKETPTKPGKKKLPTRPKSVASASGTTAAVTPKAIAAPALHDDSESLPAEATEEALLEDEEQVGGETAIMLSKDLTEPPAPLRTDAPDPAPQPPVIPTMGPAGPALPATTGSEADGFDDEEATIQVVKKNVKVDVEISDTPEPAPVASKPKRSRLRKAVYALVGLGGLATVGAGTVVCLGSVGGGTAWQSGTFDSTSNKPEGDDTKKPATVEDTDTKPNDIDVVVKEPTEAKATPVFVYECDKNGWPSNSHLACINPEGSDEKCFVDKLPNYADLVTTNDAGDPTGINWVDPEEWGVQIKGFEPFSPNPIKNCKENPGETFTLDVKPL